MIDFYSDHITVSFNKICAPNNFVGKYINTLYNPIKILIKWLEMAGGIMLKQEYLLIKFVYQIKCLLIKYAD